MTVPQPSVTLQHGTTRHRAERLLSTSPDPDFIEPGGGPYARAEGFSAVIAGEADLGLGSAEHYARKKAANFPDEGGAVILEVEVPAWIVDILRNDPFAAMVVQSHEIRFEPGLGLEELRQAWPNLVMRIVEL
jgi:hypothetical protein